MVAVVAAGALAGGAGLVSGLLLRWLRLRARLRVTLWVRAGTDEDCCRPSLFLHSPKLLLHSHSPPLPPDELVKSRSPTRADRPALPPEAKAVSSQFADYLKTRVRTAGITDLSRNIQSFIEKVHKRVEVLPIEELSVMVQTFYQALAKRLETHDNFVGLTAEERQTICDLSERYIMVCCYKPLFCPFTTTDEEEDLETQAKIRSLNWVTAAHLECPFKETAPAVRDQIYTAINDILELDGLRCPQDKLASVVSCSKKVFEVLQAGGTEQASADDFLPSLIYILLKANPPRIWSNINFITRWA
jgi:hypothetical protein